MHIGVLRASFMAFLIARGNAQLFLSPVPNSQPLRGPEFSGTPATANPMQSKTQFQPPTTMMHGDGANTGSTDFHGPLGLEAKVNSTSQTLGVMLWGANGTLCAGVAATDDVDESGPPRVRLGLAAYDPDTLHIQAEWFPKNPNDGMLNLGYMQLRIADNSVLVSSIQGRLYVVQRRDSADSTSLVLEREIDLEALNAFHPGETLMNSMFDSDGNIWFTTGAISGDQSSSTVGYVEPDGTLHRYDLPGHAIENGIALNGTTAYVITGPSSLARNPSAGSGSILAFTTTSGNEVQVLWEAEYDSGSGRKLGGFARGGGATPSLLGNEYVTVTDNADGQINLLVLHQKTQERQDGMQNQIFCTVPLFREGLSANDIRMTVHSDGETHSIVVLNGYNAPPPQYVQDSTSNFTVNGPFNNMTGMPGGIVRIDVSEGGCEVRWEISAKMKAVPVLSTATGILYGYTQEEDLAMEGYYVWYFVGIDWQSGDVLWKHRAGAGGTYNDNFFPGSIGPNGRFYQGVLAGMVWIEDEVY
ncbi:hypothetical protein S7711_11127 [Stachybotrys chartarum IBT 7711]|uniref:Uncharacterized protein n=1 Tax=Stachybotrys chartarum (strain CBS 109288 / IBT 7711) TaxID=1280523 RepID=A0A084BAI6_STACB|nr:hypothetical protein S7711_11127 [Stachybotrys chartarum IBT 7711]